MQRLLSSIALVCVLVLPLAAKADSITLTLTPSTQSGKPGTTVNFYGTVAAPTTNTGVEYLNGDSFTFGAAFTIDDSPFFNNPNLISLAPGQSVTGLLFDIVVPSGNFGLYSGSFSILGGSTTSSYSTLTTANFQLNTTPEPSSIVLLGTGLLGAIGVVRRKYRRA